MERVFEAMTWRKVSFGVLTEDYQEREYQVSRESNNQDVVFIYSEGGGDMKVPISDLPLLISALEEFLP